jgi:hypothetical protein
MEGEDIAQFCNDHLDMDIRYDCDGCWVEVDRVSEAIEAVLENAVYTGWHGMVTITNEVYKKLQDECQQFAHNSEASQVLGESVKTSDSDSPADSASNSV